MLVLLIGICLLAQGFAKECPTDAAFVDLCKCNSYYHIFYRNTVEISCLGLLESNYQSILEATRGITLDELKLYKSKFSELNVEDLQGISALTLIINNAIIENVETGALAEIEQLEQVFIVKTAMETVPDITNCSTLLTLSIQYHKITEIGQYDFPNISKLTTLEIVEGHLRAIKEDAFVNLKSLQNLVLTNNFLSELPSVLSGPNSQLSSVNLMGNHLEALPAKLFSNDQQLQKLNLRENMFNTLTSEPFLNLAMKNVDVDLRENPLKCDTKLSWLVQYIETSDYYMYFRGTCHGSGQYHGHATLKYLTSDKLGCESK